MRRLYDPEGSLRSPGSLISTEVFLEIVSRIVSKIASQIVSKIVRVPALRLIEWSSFVLAVPCGDLELKTRFKNNPAMSLKKGGRQCCSDKVVGITYFCLGRAQFSAASRLVQ